MLGTSWWFTYVYLGHALALFSSFHRLHLKLEKSKFWWQDLLYLVAEAFNAVLFGVVLYIHIHYYQEQQVFPKTAYIISLDGYFMSAWLVRAGIYISYARGLRDCVITDGLIRKQVAITVLCIFTGIAFSISGTAICISNFARVQEHFPLMFIIPVILADILVDSYAVFTTYKFFMASNFRPIRKIFVIAGLCGPLSTMLITTISWTLSLTLFLSNALAQMSMLNLTVCYSMAMGSMPNMMRSIYHQQYPNAEATPITSIIMTPRLPFRRSATSEPAQTENGLVNPDSWDDDLTIA